VGPGMIPRPGRSFDAGVLAAADAWGASTVAIAVVDADGVVASRGPLAAVLPWASVTKVATALAVLAGVERGVLALDDEAGPPGATVRHVLAHAAGYAFDGTGIVAAPGRQRVYSNTGYEVLADRLADAAGRPFQALLGEWVLEPLGMAATRLTGPPSHGLEGPAADLAVLARELLAPRGLPPGLVVEAATVAFPGLRGVLPGFGLQDPNDWGLGPEIRGRKAPHWTGSRNSPATFGHFGRTGSFLWVDPVAGLGLACLTNRPFGPWAAEAWPALSDAVLAEGAGAGSPATPPTSPRSPDRP
jgi:CubicO group peptidase (beta-lactamase class C family)